MSLQYAHETCVCHRLLLWRRSDNICFVLLLGSSEGLSIGEGAVCQIRAILQVVLARLQV